MSATSFRSVFMVASCAGAALGCYLVSLRVASERAALEQVETEIVLAERDIRLLQTEIGTRGRLAQLERWNVQVLALSAPSADQFVNGGFELARMVTPQRKIDLQAPVVLASAPAQGAKPQVQGTNNASPAEQPVSRSDLMHTASFKRTLPAAAKAPEAKPTQQPKATAPITKSASSPAKPVEKKLATVMSKTVAKQPKPAKSDPLAPLSASKASKPVKDSRQKP